MAEPTPWLTYDPRQHEDERGDRSRRMRRKRERARPHDQPHQPPHACGFWGAKCESRPFIPPPPCVCARGLPNVPEERAAATLSAGTASRSARTGANMAHCRWRVANLAVHCACALRPFNAAHTGLPPLPHNACLLMVVSPPACTYRKQSEVPGRVYGHVLNRTAPPDLRV